MINNLDLPLVAEFCKCLTFPKQSVDTFFYIKFFFFDLYKNR